MGNFLYDFCGAEGPEESDQYLIAVKEWDILFTGDIVRPVAEDLHDNVGSRKYGPAFSNDFCALVGILGVGIPGFDTCPGLHVNFEASFGECRENRWHQRNPSFSGVNFFRHTDYQESLPVPRF
jgi:hypothetical protein